ncbi:MAG: bifunctional nuclease family protein [candidate division Zixibacteria bacterium]|nr:bifunctional nuclease family protein [candidate division Zixibacteria bacterium]
MKIDLLEMRVAVVTHDPNTNRPVLILKNEDAGKILPIWIGPYEAYAIMMAIEGVEPTRPMTHDLIKGLVDALDARVESVVVNDLSDNTFYARIIIETGDGTLEVDARPSDAIAVALRTESPIYVAREVIEISGADAEVVRESRDDLASLLENLSPDDFDFDKPS